MLLNFSFLTQQWILSWLECFNKNIQVKDFEILITDFLLVINTKSCRQFKRLSTLFENIRIYPSVIWISKSSTWIFFVESFTPEKYPLLVQKINIQSHPEDPLEKMLLIFSEQVIQYQHSVH